MSFELSQPSLQQYVPIMSWCSLQHGIRADGICCTWHHWVIFFVEFVVIVAGPPKVPWSQVQWIRKLWYHLWRTYNSRCVCTTVMKVTGSTWLVGRDRLRIHYKIRKCSNHLVGIVANVQGSNFSLRVVSSVCTSIFIMQGKCQLFLFFVMPTLHIWYVPSLSFELSQSSLQQYVPAMNRSSWQLGIKADDICTWHHWLPFLSSS